MLLNVIYFIKILLHHFIAVLPSSSSQRSRALPAGRGSWVGKRKWRRENEFLMAGIDGKLLFGKLIKFAWS